jgi:hypothetical protein
MNFYSYLYRDPITNIPRYAGKGQEKRAWCHLKKRCDNKTLKGWLKNLKEQNLQPIIEVIPALDEDHALFLEECFIKIFGRIDKGTGTLFNHTDGGEGVSGYRHTLESKEKIRKTSIDRKYPPMSKEQKEYLSKINMGKKLSEETCLKMSRTRTGKSRPEIKNRPRTEKELINLKSMTEKVKIKVEVFGIIYSSVRDAAKAIGVHEETTRYRCRSSGFPEYKIVGNTKCQE